MKKNIRKKTLLTMSTALLLLVAVGATLAYVFTRTDPVENTFKPSRVACAVVENGDTHENTNHIVKISTTKTNVMIKNTGDTDAYIRVAVVVNWMSENGSRVWATKPTSSDYTINFADNTGWTKDSDGYYYYKEAVPRGELTSILISSASQNAGVSAPVGTDGTQYHLSVEIVASAIQAKGIDAASAQEAWVKAQRQNG